ncbi:hypothetical protein BDU57DRAFT_510962 [Ampelomyces quisqualis]|uniref:Uncharacterized protein n=1 Tax=Ampelomyces quisqualis TaxID=50730 RepID=A0A6A5R1H4_AMPQU|nr:hypothetical protein BDU57DRAFT_510962 [Ampelomyces quisqualis]
MVCAFGDVATVDEASTEVLTQLKSFVERLNRSSSPGKSAVLICPRPQPHRPLSAVASGLGLSSSPANLRQGASASTPHLPSRYRFRSLTSQNSRAMGIPVGWNISKEDAKQKDVLRADVTGQRSPIRRRMRPTRSPRSQSALEADFLAHVPRLSPHAEPVLRSSHARTRLAPPPVPEVSRAAYRGSDSSRDPPGLHREDASFRRMRNRSDPDARAWETRASLSHERSLPALTPGFAPAAASRNTDSYHGVDPRDDEQRTTGAVPETEASLHALLARRWDSREPALRGDDSAEGLEDGRSSSDSNAVGFPPLRRMGRRNIADGPLPTSSLRESWSPASTVDGLGDRERSFSPSESSHWETFLGTIVPDAVAPTAESSFTSAAASASFSNAHLSSRASSSNTSASSLHTHLTVPSRRPSLPVEERLRACETSDDDTASDTEAEDDAAPTAETISNRYNSANLRRAQRESYGYEPPHRNPEPYSRRVLERSRNAIAYVHDSYRPSQIIRRRGLHEFMSSPYRSTRMREHTVDPSRMEQLDGPVDGLLSASEDEVPLMVSNSPALDQELREARSLLERLSRREDVSDDFWASVGLTRSFADRVASFNEREQF